MKLYSVCISANITAVDPLDALTDVNELTVKELLELYGTSLAISEAKDEEPESTEQTDEPVKEVE